MISLFTYGVLASERVIALLIGRLPHRARVSLRGYRANLIVLDGWQPFPVLTQDAVGVTDGYLYFNLTPREVRILDRFEGVSDGLFERRRIREAFGEEAWAYLPSRKLTREGQIREEWDVSKMAAVEAIYCELVIPEFRIGNKDIYE
jgi:hypothetical protein